jgi:transcription antitermination factor NusG
MHWYAIRVMSNRERLVANGLVSKGLEVCLPLCHPDGRKKARSERVLFPGYVLSAFDAAHPLPVLMIPGVVQIVCCGRTPQPVDAAEMEAVRKLVQSGLCSQGCDYIRAGERVRVCEGPLAGVEGIAVRNGGLNRMIISVSLLMRSVMVEIDQCNLEAIPSQLSDTVRATKQLRGRHFADQICGAAPARAEIAAGRQLADPAVRDTHITAA